MQIVALCFEVFAVAVQKNNTENTLIRAELDVYLVSPHKTTIKEIIKTQKKRDNRTENPHIHKHMAPMPHWFTVNVIKAFVMIRCPFPLTCFCPVCVRVCGSSGSRVAHLSLINSSPSSYITPVSPPLQRQINTTCMAICNAALWVCLII